MKNKDDFKYYKFSYPTLGNRIINFLVAISSNLIALRYSFFIFLIIGIISDRVLYKAIGFRYGFVTYVLIFIVALLVLDLIYIFSKKGIYLYKDNRVVVKYGFFALSNYYNTRRFKYSFYTYQIKSIYIYSDKKGVADLESPMYLSKHKYYVIIELINCFRIALPLEDNLGFVNEILERKNS